MRIKNQHAHDHEIYPFIASADISFVQILSETCKPPHPVVLCSVSSVFITLNLEPVRNLWKLLFVRCLLLYPHAWTKQWQCHFFVDQVRDSCLSVKVSRCWTCSPPPFAISKV
jgi:hypothetical protein